MQYAEALPALITDNIGDAPLTVILCPTLNDFAVFLIDGLLGLDLDSQAHHPDGVEASLYKVDMEIFG
jgi:hypothetical protein